MTDEAKRIVEWMNAYIKTDPCHKVHMSDMVFGDYGNDWMWLDDICKQAADLIESLSAELEATEAIAALARGLEVERNQLKARLEHVEYERDAAVEGLRGVCRACVHYNDNEMPFCCYFEECANGMDNWDSEDYWQWRGPKEVPHD